MVLTRFPEHSLHLSSRSVFYSCIVLSNLVITRMQYLISMKVKQTQEVDSRQHVNETNPMCSIKDANFERASGNNGGFFFKYHYKRRKKSAGVNCATVGTEGSPMQLLGLLPATSDVG